MSNDIRTWSGSTNEVFSTGSSSSTRSSYPILATTPLSEVVERGGAICMLDPMQVLASMAVVTERLGLAATMSTTLHHPSPPLLHRSSLRDPRPSQQRSSRPEEHTSELQSLMRN